MPRMFILPMDRIFGSTTNCSLLVILVFVPCVIIALDPLSSPSSAVCFLTRHPSSQITRFASQLAQNIPYIHVYIVVDNNTASIPSSTVRFIQVTRVASVQNGFREANMPGTRKTCSAWDKALYYFSKVATSYSFVWFVEEDVFIPSVKAFLSLHKLYSPAHDLVTGALYYNKNGRMDDWPHSPRISGMFVLPWAHGLVCAVGCSRRLLSRVSDYVKWRGELTFIEFLFHTIVIHEKQLKMVKPVELDTLIFRQDYTLVDIRKRPNNWWHPVKNLTLHDEWRTRLAHNSSAYRNETFVAFRALHEKFKRTATTNTIYDLQNQLNNLLASFEVIKGQLDPSDRHQLRDEFLQLASNRYDDLTAEIMRLADHAFKLPEPYLDPYIDRNRTVVHLKLEKAIASKKETIYRLLKKQPRTADRMARVAWLRRETKQLIIDLTNEIRCMEGRRRCNRTRQWTQYENQVERYASPDFSRQLPALTVLFLCLLLILYKMKRTKCCC